MLWLFGQIWLWLLISFALGAGLTALLLLAGRGRRSSDEPEPTPSADRTADKTDDRTEAEPPRPTAAEETQQIYFGTPPPRYAEPAAPPDLGRKAGTLPTEGDWRARDDWPREDDVPPERNTGNHPHRGG